MNVFFCLLLVYRQKTFNMKYRINHVSAMAAVFMSSLLTCLGQIACPVPWWYCLNRDPKDSGQVRVEDTSNRSITWAWDTGSGRWDVAYVHSFTSGYYGVDACFTDYRQNQPSCCSYNTAASWNSNVRPIAASAWDMTYNGDSFGFRPGPGGQYVFHIYSRNLHYNPWVSNGGGGIPPRPEPPVIQDPRGTCQQSSNDRTQGNGWWLERKSPMKCFVVVNRNDVISPMEWVWSSDAGNWKVVYSWNNDIGNCSVDFTPAGAAPSRLVEWSFQPEQLILTYRSNPIKVYRENSWKLMMTNGETWGFSPATEGSWNFPVYSRNVVIRPSERTSGSFNLQFQ